jgi:DNA invertase Pin-like site-specific DNA recombinase
LIAACGSARIPAFRVAINSVRKESGKVTRGALLKVLDCGYLDLTQPINRGLLALLSAFAEDERKRIHKRAADGRVAARTRGARMGRKPKLSDVQQQEAQRRVHEGESARQIARFLGCHHTTVSRLRDVA